MTEQKKKTIVNFRKAHSLLSKVIKMVEEDNYCVNIMQQNLAILGLLKSAHQMLMENHLNTCFKGAIESKNSKRKEEMTKEILKVTKLLNR